MNNRIVELRKNLGISQDAFAKEIGLSRNFLSLVETGARGISDRTISDICNVFEVNEIWLRSGEGEMFKPLDRATQISRITKRLLKAEDDDFVYRLINVLVNLDDNQIEVLKGIGEQLYKEQKDSTSD